MKRLTLVFVSLFFALGLSAQSTWFKEGDYRLYGMQTVNRSFSCRYTVFSSSTDSVVYNNYPQFNDFPATTHPYGNFSVMMGDSATPLGIHRYYPISDEVTLFRLGLMMPNHPTASRGWTSLSVYKDQLHIDALSSDWSYDSILADSVLTISLSVVNASNVEQPGDRLQGTSVVYGKTIGLVRFSAALASFPGGQSYCSLVYSSHLGIGKLPQTAREVFAYHPGMEIHTFAVQTEYGIIDSIYTLRKILTLQENGSLLKTQDSIYTTTRRYTLIGQGTWSDVEIRKTSETKVNSEIDLGKYSFLTQDNQTPLYPYDSLFNQEFKQIIGNTPFAPFELILGTEVYYGTVTYKPPYFYESTYDPINVGDQYWVFYPGVGGPFLREYYGFHSIREYPVFVADSTGQKGTPLDFSILSSSRGAQKIQIGLYPNPAEKTVHIDLSEEASWNLKVISLDGKVLTEVPFEGNSLDLNVDQLNPGVYLLRIQSETATITERLLIQR